MSIDIKTLEILARSNAHSSARQVESMITMAEKECELQKISGMSVENLITLFLAGYTLEPPQPSVSLAEFAEENDIAKKNECRMSMTESERLTFETELGISIDKNEDCPTMSICWNCDIKVKDCKYFNDVVEKLAKYEAIGTIEEFKDLKEQNEPKKVLDFQANKMQSFCEDDFGRDTPCMIDVFQFICPNCNRKIASRFKVERCPNCKRELNWQRKE